MKKEKIQKKQKTQKEEFADANPILSSIIKARESSKQRGFPQTWDFIINFKGLNMKKPENRFTIDVTLPKGRAREPTVVIFADSIAAEATKAANVVVRKDEIPTIAKDKKRMGEVTGCDIFMGEASLMALIGKELGQLLAPRGKMPRPIPPNVKLDAFVSAAKKSMRISLKENPTIHTAVGNDRMADADVAANADAVFTAVRDKLPKGINNIKSVIVKLTMGKPVKVAVK